jgi:hypothetical protein
MKTTWYKGLNEKEKEEIISSFNASGRLRARMQVILQEKIEEMYAKRRSENAYENPNWAYKQADASGYERAIAEIMSLMHSEGINS